MTSSQQSVHLSHPGLPSIPVAELHQRWHSSWLPCPCEPCWPTSQGQPQEGESPEQLDRQLSESAQPAGGHASEERTICCPCSQEQLPHSHRCSYLNRYCVALLLTEVCGKFWQSLIKAVLDWIFITALKVYSSLLLQCWPLLLSDVNYNKLK